MRRARAATVAWLDHRTALPRRRHGEALFWGHQPNRIDGLAASLYYTAAAGLWRHRSESPGYLDAFRSGLEQCPPPGSVIDIGTGTGASAAAAAERHPSARVVGIDASRRMVRLAGELHHQPNLSFTRARYDRLPFTDGAFDLACMLNAIADPAELRRVLRSGGHVLVVSSFFAVPPAAWFERWEEVGFECLEAEGVGGGHWELFRGNR
jgi:SAM-dependent methyltransferase